MSKRLTIVLGFVFLVFIGAIGLVGSVIGINNDLVAQEEGLKAQYKQNQNNYDNYIKKLLESAQVTENYASDLKSLYKDAMAGRYGADGSKAVFQFLKEQNPNLDPSMYSKLQQMIEAGRNSFEAEQKSLLDKKRVYETGLRTFPNNLVAKFLGFPSKEIAEIDIVTSASTEETFRTKKSEPVNLKR